MVLQLCKLRNIKTAGEENTVLLQCLFKDLLSGLRDKASEEYRNTMDNPYRKQANGMLKRILILLMVNNVRLEEKVPYSAEESEASADSE
jgi:hypothetical protein